MKCKFWKIELLAILLLLGAMGCHPDEIETVPPPSSAPPKPAKDPNSFSTTEADPKMMEVRTAIARGKEQVLRDLITATPSLATATVHTASGNITPLVYASTFFRTNIADVLLSAGADINGKDVGWLTPLRAALRAEQERMTAHLILRGVDLKAAEADPKCTPLLNEAIESDFVAELLGMMIDRGADVNRADWNGQTPLHIAAKKKRKDVMAFLIEKGAKQDARNKDGKTAAELFAQLTAKPATTEASPDSNAPPATAASSE